MAGGRDEMFSSGAQPGGAGGMASLNPQPEPPGMRQPGDMTSLNPQPEPPGMGQSGGGVWLNPQPEPPGMGRPDGAGRSRRGLLIGGLAVLVIAGLVVGGLNLGHLLPGASSPSHIVSGGGVPTTTVAPTIPPTAVPTTPAAPTGQMVLRHNTTAVTVPADSRKTLHASCKAGEQMVGGGFWTGGASPFAQIEESYPSGLNEWTVTVFNQRGTQPLQALAFADCLQTSVSLNMSIQSATKTIQNGSGDSFTSSCPAGDAVTGGGYQITLGSQGLVYMSQAQLNPAGWLVALNAPAETLTTKAFAMCAGAHLINQPAGKQFTVGGASIGTWGTVTCPSSAYLLTQGGAGPGSSPSLVRINISSPGTDTTASGSTLDHWVGGGTNYSTSSMPMYVSVLCSTLA